MIGIGMPHSLSKAFQRGAHDAAYRHRLALHDKQERERRAKQNEMDQTEPDFLDLAGALITVEQAAFFQTEIDAYQLATIETLEENRLAIEDARDRRDEIMARAHRLDSGQIVFKTENGLTVYDRMGNEVSNDIITPDEIADHLPRWETARDVMNELERLEAERTELLEFQSDLDEAQDLLDIGELTQSQFDDLRNRLATDAPESVGVRISEGGMEHDAISPSITQDADLDLSAELSAMPVPKPFVPGGG